MNSKNYYISSCTCKCQPKDEFTMEEAAVVAEALGINFANEEFTLCDFTDGMNVELEHGKKSPMTNVTDDDPIITGKIALAHLNEFPDYYIRLLAAGL